MEAATASKARILKTECLFVLLRLHTVPWALDPSSVPLAGAGPPAAPPGSVSLRLSQQAAFCRAATVMLAVPRILPSSSKENMRAPVSSFCIFILK